MINRILGRPSEGIQVQRLIVEADVQVSAARLFELLRGLSPSDWVELRIRLTDEGGGRSRVTVEFP